jgi:hypothetical protein
MAREPVDAFVDFDNREMRRRAMSWVGTLTGIWRWRMEPKRNTRSLRQNAFYWSAVVTPLWEYLRQHGIKELRTKDDVHAMLKLELLTVDVVNPDTAEVIGRTTRSTTKLSTDEMGRYIEDCRDWAQEKVGIDLITFEEPEPASA